MHFNMGDSAIFSKNHEHLRVVIGLESDGLITLCVSKTKAFADITS